MINLKKIKFCIYFYFRLKYWFCHNSSGFFSKLPYYFIGNVRKIIFGSFVLFFALLSNNFKFTSHLELKRVEAYLHKKLRFYELYLSPSYVNYPMIGQIILSKKCNYSCDYCYQRDLPIIELDFSSYKKVLQHFKKLNINYVRLLGGELFISFQKLLKYIDIANDVGITINSITTNGYWCSSDSKIFSILSELKNHNFSGQISISIGRDHRKYQNTLKLINLHKISKKIFGRNIFSFSIEALSLKEFKYLKKRYLKILKHRYLFIYHGLIHNSIKRIPEDLFWSHCLAKGISFNKHYSFCCGVNGVLKEYKLNLNDDFSLNELLTVNDKFLDLINFFTFEKLRQYILKNEISYDVDSFSYPCELCSLLSKNPQLVNELHEALF